MLEDDLSTNEKKTQQKIKKIELENERRELSGKSKEHKEFNIFLNSQLKLKREKFLVLSEYIDENLGDIKDMDDIICAIDKSPNKCVIFTSFDVDALSFKRKNYKGDLENFKKFLTDSSMLEKEIYNDIIKLVKNLFKFFLSKMNNRINLKMKLLVRKIRNKLFR